MNPSAGQVVGQIQLFNDDGLPLEMELEGVTGISFAYQIDPNGTFQGELTSASGTNVGYAVVTLEQGSQSPAGTAIFQFTSGLSVLSEAGVAATRATRLARIFVDNVGTRTGENWAEAIPGGESLSRMKHRVLAGWKEIWSHSWDRAMIIAHGGTNRILLAEFLGIPDEYLFRIEQDHLRLNWIEFSEDTPTVKIINSRFPS